MWTARVCLHLEHRRGGRGFGLHAQGAFEYLESKGFSHEASPMNHGDCFKLRLDDHWPEPLAASLLECARRDFKMQFPDPRPFVQQHGALDYTASLLDARGLVPGPVSMPLMGKEGYGAHGK